MYIFCLLVSQFDLLELVSQRFTCQQWLWRHSDSVGCFHWIKDQVFSGTPCIVLRICDKNAFPPSPPPSIINITNSVDNTKLSRYINDFHLRTIVLKEEKETEITHVLVNPKNNWSVSPIISLLHAVTSWPFVFVRRNMKRDVGAWISITLIQNF